MITFSDSQKKPRKIIAIGIGGAGYNIINYIVANSLPGVDTCFIDSNKDTIKRSLAENKHCIPKKLIQEAEAKAVNSREAGVLTDNLKVFANTLPGAEIVFTISGLGGGVGAIVMPLIIPILKQRPMWIWSVATLPFFFEGKLKIVNSLKRLKSIQEAANAVMVVPHDKIFKMVDKNLSVKEVFTPANNLCAELVLAVTRLTCVEEPDRQIKIRFDDIKRKLIDKRITSFGIGSDSGPARVRKAIEQAVSGPLVDKKILHSAEGIIIDICGGNNLSLDEIKKGMEFLQAEVSPKANISFGITIDKKLKDRAQVSLIALGIDSDSAANNWDLIPLRADEDSPSGRGGFTRRRPGGGFPGSGRYRKAEQTMINFKQLSKGRFEKTKTTLSGGIDLDIPTFLRKKR